MTALSAAKYGVATKYLSGEPQSYLMKASTQVWKGGLVMTNTSGTAEPAAAATTSRKVVGVARESVLSTASGNERIEVETGLFLLTGTTLGQDDVGKPVYVVDDATIDETPPVNTIPAGIMIEYVSATSAWVLVDPTYVGGSEAVQRHTFGQRALSTIADGDLLTEWTPGFAGRLLGLEVYCDVAVTTADKTSTLNLEIGTTNVTGGTLEITSAGLAAIGDVMASASIPTAGNVFGATDTVSVEASSTTDFIEGEATFAIKYAQFLG